MMKKFWYFSLIILSSCCRVILQNDLPMGDSVLKRKVYTIGYDSQHRQPRWVYQQLTIQSHSSHALRESCEFQEDSDVPNHLQSKKTDYKGSSFDRGHLCPAADATKDLQSMEETFYLSNISPQLPQFNRGYWKKLEQYTRSLVNRYGTLHVYTGPLYVSHQEPDGKKYITYQVIGDNEVAVPTHYFKIIFYQYENQSLVKAYMIPHQTISLDTPFSKFEVPIEHIEKKAGIIFPRH